ncbi:MAG: iron ABC transporter substrate-binding protein [Rhodothermales bacterium]
MRIAAILALTAVFLTSCTSPDVTTLTVYSGRSQSLVQPLLDAFQAETGIEVEVRFGDTAQLAVALLEEGEQSPADLFWAQDAGALGAIQDAGLFAPLPDELTRRAGAGFSASDGAWVATSGRARVLAWSSDRLEAEALPASILDLTDPRWAGRVGWAPTNGSFQAAVTAMRVELGEDATREWLMAMSAAGTKAYSNNRSIIEAIANGEIDLGLPNHYYLYRYKADDAAYPVEQTFFEPGDIGNLINVAGIGRLTSSGNAEAAERLIAYLLSDESQEFFARETFEYPVVEGIAPSTRIADYDRISDLKPDVRLENMRDLESTLTLLRSVGLL